MPPINKPHYGKPGSTLSPEVQAEIIRLAQQPGATRNGIATKLGVARASVSRICSRHEPPITFDRAASTAKATATRRADLAALRAEASYLLVQDALRLRGQMWEPHEYIDHGGKDFDEARWVQDEPSPADKLKLMQAAAAALGRHLNLEQHDSGSAAEGTKSMLAELGRALGIADRD